MSMSPSIPAGPQPGAGAERLLEELDPEQRAVALALRGPVRVLAGAGTGKTRAITSRIAYGVATGVYVPSRVLAVTFTTRAAAEMRARLHRLGASGVQARTFHSAALRQARYFWPKVYGGELPRLTESKLGLVATAARRNRLSADPALLRDVASEIEWSKVSNVRPDDYAEVAAAKGRLVADLDSATIAHVFASYEEVKREAGRMDMEDVLLCAAAVLTEDDRVAAEVRRQYHHFVVDEFQDLSPVQWALLRLWLGGRDELCVVGDPAQTIYSFAGASPRYLLDLPRHLAGTTTIDLVRNYRSTPEVVAAANALLRGTGSGGVQLQAQSEPGPSVRYTEHPDEVAEAEAVAAEIRRLVDDGTPPGQVAVLFRINAQSEVFEAALADAGLPYVVRGAERFFERPEVRQAVALVRGSARAEEVDGRSGVVDRVRGVVAGMGWTPAPPASRGNVRDRWESLQALVDLATAFAEEHPGAGVAELVADLDRRASERHAPVADAVTVATLHAAKGLEWDAVFLCGAVEGTLPISYALDSPAAVEEERRLCYVGMTRARRRLSVSWALSRNPGGRATRRPSRFLDGLRPEDRESAASLRVPRARRERRPLPTTCRSCGARLGSVSERKVGRCTGCPPTYDVATFDRLRAWRLQVARDQSLPAFTVFTDATLVAIAEARPRTAEELLRISGVGEAKRAKYGDAVLEILADEPAGV